jgi:uncharacterized protein
MRRRHLLLAALGLPSAGMAHAAGRGSCPVMAAWQDNDTGRCFAGVLLLGQGARVRVVQAIEVPTRAHGLTQLPDGRALAIARRPGEWMMTWRPGAPGHTLHWCPPGRSLCGHAVVANGSLLSSAMDLETEQGVVQVHDLNSLRTQARWATGGIDPHELLVMPDGRLLVANGGVPTRPETGRLKRLQEPMDSSLVAIDPRTGRLDGPWRLADAALSIRHLALHASGLVGVALQAEHGDAGDRMAAPLLAVFDGKSLRPVPGSGGLAGYAGAIAATQEGFALGASRAGHLLSWSARSGRCETRSLPDACAVAVSSAVLWTGGREVLEGAGDTRQALPPGLQLDNHWSVLQG